jgi:16S rRNA (guanine527-N7)-methyltransferase
VSELLARIRDRATSADIALTDEQLKGLEGYYSLLALWNRRVNLTALSLDDYRDSTLDRLLIEPLVAAKFVANSDVVWFDLGSGGGSPAIPLKLVRLQARLRMVESRVRKAAFLREAVRSLELPDAEVVERRIESLSRDPDPALADVVTVRAVRMDEAVTAAAAALVRRGGHLLAFCSAASTIPVAGTFRDLETIRLPGAGSVLRVFGRIL